MKNTVRALFIFVLMLTVFALGSAAQKNTAKSAPALWEDTAINPHDFNDSFYEANGVNPKAIYDRRDGNDLLSVYGPSSNPNHSPIRVLVTLPAYDPEGNIQFWYPLGRLNDDGFTLDKMGDGARETALASPIYIFPAMTSSPTDTVPSFSNMRQAALMGWSASYYPDQRDNPVGIRAIIVVNFTPKAFGKEGHEMMMFMAKKNGFTTDGMPLIRNVDDMLMLFKQELVTLETKSLWDAPQNRYAMVPVIADPTGGVIAKDAFLFLSKRDGNTLPTEEIFDFQFGCLQKGRNWCKY